MQTGPAMIDQLQNEVKPGEQLLWWGTPDPARKAKAVNTTTTAYIIYGILSVLMAGLVIFDIHLLQEDIMWLSGPDPFTVLMLLIGLGLLGINLYRIYATYSVTQKQITNLRNTIYGITNQRVIVMTAGQQGFAVNSYTRNEMGQINRIETGDGWGDVSFGRPRQIQRGTRTLTIVEKLVGVSDVRRVEDILIRTFKNTPPAMVPGQPVLPVQSYPPMPQHYMQQPPQSRE